MRGIKGNIYVNGPDSLGNKENKRSKVMMNWSTSVNERFSSFPDWEIVREALLHAGKKIEDTGVIAIELGGLSPEQIGQIINDIVVLRLKGFFGGRVLLLSDVPETENALRDCIRWTLRTSGPLEGEKLDDKKMGHMLANFSPPDF